MPQPPRVISAFKCPYCSGVFTIRWIHPWSLVEYDTSYLICPCCNQRLRSDELRQVGTFPAFQADHPIRRLATKEAEYQKNKGLASQSATAPIALPQKTTNHKASPPAITITDKVPLPPSPVKQKLHQPEGHRASPSNTIKESVSCEPLIEACTLNLYQRNIFRITGLPVDATQKEVARQAQKLQMMDEISGGGTLQSQAAFPLAPPPTTEQIREALARMKEPEHRLVDEFFWYWPEKFGDSKNDPAIQAVLAGKAQEAIDLWVERESFGRSLVAKHNLAIMFHMFAVDWTNHHVTYDIDKGRDEKIKSYWQDAIERWEVLADADEIWDVMKERVRSLADEALTTGFVRRMRRVMPQAFDRVNAEAALKFAEQGRMDWAKYHVDYMRQTNQGLDDVDSTAELVLEPTRKRVEQRLNAARHQAEEQPAKGTQVASDLMSHCRPLLAVFDLFHGAESHHRSELFDEVAETVADVLVSYQKSTGNNQAFVDLLRQALAFASGSHIRERLIKNIAIGEGNLIGQQLEPFFAGLKQITDSTRLPVQKLQELQTKILPQLPSLAGRLGSASEVYHDLMNSVAIALRSIAIEAHNKFHDFVTSRTGMELAQRFAVDLDLKLRIANDLKELKTSELTASVVAKNNSGSGCLLLAILPLAGLGLVLVSMTFLALR